MKLLVWRPVVSGRSRVPSKTRAKVELRSSSLTPTKRSASKVMGSTVARKKHRRQLGAREKSSKSSKREVVRSDSGRRDLVRRDSSRRESCAPDGASILQQVLMAVVHCLSAAVFTLSWIVLLSSWK